MRLVNKIDQLIVEKGLKPYVTDIHCVRVVLGRTIGYIKTSRGSAKVVRHDSIAYWEKV